MWILGLKGVIYIRLYETDTSFNIQTPSKKLEMRCCETFQPGVLLFAEFYGSQDFDIHALLIATDF